MNLPPGEMHLLTIDRVVDDVKCNHEGPMLMGAWCKCVKGMMISSPGFQMGNCPKCKGTGKRRIRVRGWCEVERGADTIGVWDVKPYAIICSKTDYKLDDFRSAIIAAWRDGTLPDGVADIREVGE